MVGKMNRRPTFYNESFTIDAGGGPTGVITEQWQSWARIDNRTGNTYAAQATELTGYDYRVKVRFDGRFTSNTTMVYEGQVCKCGSMEIETEGYKNYLILRFSKTDTWLDLS
jgi:SPP1 family predicted phage head-tail adaptor